jgi:hypothetical protein
MSKYEDARHFSNQGRAGVPLRKKVYGDESHLGALYSAIGEMQVPVSDPDAYKMATTAGDAISSATIAHRSGNHAAASMKAFETAQHISVLANHLISNHGTTEARAKFAGDIPQRHATDYVDSVNQHKDDEFRMGGN